MRQGAGAVYCFITPAGAAGWRVFYDSRADLAGSRLGHSNRPGPPRIACRRELAITHTLPAAIYRIGVSRPCNLTARSKVNV